MTYGAFTQDFASYDYVDTPRRQIPQAALCAMALALSTSVGLWALYGHPTSTAPDGAIAQRLAAPAAPKVSKRPSAKIAAAPQHIASLAQAPAPVSTVLRPTPPREPSLLYPYLTSTYHAGSVAQSAPLRSSFTPRVAHAPEKAPQIDVAALETPAAPSSAVVPTPSLPEATAPEAKFVPVPTPRPTSLAAAPERVPPAIGGRRAVLASVGAPRPVAPGVAPAPAQQGFFEKMFGGAQRPSGTALAYAAPEDGGLGGILGGATRATTRDQYTAVYDITNHTVHLPDGTRLEAHSGLGQFKDNPASMQMRMVGVTPPNLYQLTFREAPFHGVRALRLTPLGGTTFGRAGLLAHTYMLRGHNGDSNGCVVFKDYARFLQAFESGRIRRLEVVSRL